MHRQKFSLSTRHKDGARDPGGEVWVELDSTLDENQNISVGEAPFLEDAVEMLKGPIKAIHAGLEAAAEDVDSISISFGVKYSTGLDLVIFTLGSESNIDVQVTWNRRSGETAKGTEK